MFSSIFMIFTSLILSTMAISMLTTNTFISIKLPLLLMTTFNISIDMIMDWMSMSFLSSVIFISSMIMLFSIYYIPEEYHPQFSLMMMMFILSMSILIISNNIFLILLGWDGLGLTSYILVVFYQNHLSAASGSITLLSNRIGDIMILLSMGLILSKPNWNFSFNEHFSLLTMILLMIAACSKSAQFPFSAWLPMAMAAPTPISALVHSSTLVTAGVFIMLRINNSFHPSSLIILMIISSITALYSSMSANWEQDMKKIIALSTLSQIAMMMFSISINSINLAFLHLIIHALFKSTMFLCAGIMIHESSYQDMRMMGINFMKIPMVTSILGLTSTALMGFPFMSGFFSKDIIIEKMISSKLECSLTIMMIMSIGMTASYSLRMSMMSNKILIKAKPDMMNHSSHHAIYPITIMGPMAIISGTSMMWMFNPEQTMIMNNLFKALILYSLISGFLFGTLLSFKSHMYKSWGTSSISLWFCHFITTLPMPMLSPSMHIYSLHDNTWQESYGPQRSFNLSKQSSQIPELSKYSSLTTMIMMMMIPSMLI